MSDGMSDSSAIGRLASAVDAAAYELRDALAEAEAGHRGLMPGNLQFRVNEILGSFGGKWRVYKEPT